MFHSATRHQTSAHTSECNHCIHLTWVAESQHLYAVQDALAPVENLVAIIELCISVDNVPNCSVLHWDHICILKFLMRGTGHLDPAMSSNWDILIVQWAEIKLIRDTIERDQIYPKLLHAIHQLVVEDKDVSQPRELYFGMLDHLIMIEWRHVMFWG